MIVPVLSVHITVTLPRVSEEGSFRTRTFRLTRRFVAKASHKATTAGRPSGIAETARLTAIKNEFARFHHSKKRIPTIKRHSKTITIATFRENSSSLREKGFTSSCIWLTISDILPSSV